MHHLDQENAQFEQSYCRSHPMEVMPCSFQLEDLHELTDEKYKQLGIQNDTMRGLFKYRIGHSKTWGREPC